MSQPKAFAPTKRAKKYRKRLPKSTRGKVMALSKDVKRLKQDLRQEVEVKNYDTNTATAQLFGWDLLSVQSLNAVIPQSIAQGGRVGDEIMMTGLDLRYVVENTSASILGQARVIVFVDKDNVLPVNQVLFPTGASGTANAPMCFYNRQYREKFTILYDKLHTLDVTENAQYSERIKIPLKLKCNFQAGLTTVLNNMIKIAFIGSVNPVGSVLQYRMLSRLYYSDQ